MPETPKRKKRRHRQDGAWSKKQEGTRKAIDTTELSTESLLKLMGAGGSPAKKMAVVNSTPSTLIFENQVLTPSKYQLSTPEKGPNTSYISTPGGSILRPSFQITCDDGAMTIFLSEEKVGDQALILPRKQKAWLKSSPIPKVDLQGMVDIPITWEKIKNTDALVRQRKRKGENPRGKSQNKIMNIAATQALRKAGIAAPDKSGQWLHFIPFSFIGDEGQCAKNMGLGSRFANAAMELVNPAIRSLLSPKYGRKVIYLSAIPEWAPEYENIRLMKNLTYIIKDAPGDRCTRSAKIEFNTLSMEPVCLSDVDPVKRFIIQKFSTRQISSPSKDAAPSQPLLPAFKAFRKNAKTPPQPKALRSKRLSFS